jgi:plasmid stabilization system protein ParE
VTFHVSLAPRARTQVREIDRWWRANREAAPQLFSEELANAIDTLSLFPMAGSTYRLEQPPLRRILLPATRHHVYYDFDGETAQILAVWSAVRGTGPLIA